MATLDTIPEETARTIIKLLGYDTLRYLLDVKVAIDDTDSEVGDAATLIDDPTEDNIVTVDSDGDIQDSGKDLPSGDIVGTTDTQTLTNKTLTTPTITTPTIADLTNMTHDHTDDAGGGDYAWADMTLAATQADAVAISAVTLTAGADTVSITSCNSTFSTMRTEINAIVTAFNALIDKLQAANLMT